MAQDVREDTTNIIIVGPFVAIADAVTPITGHLLSSADTVTLVKHSTSTATDISANTFNHIAQGYYALYLSTAHCDTSGRADILIVDSSQYLPVWKELAVLSDDAWLAKYSDTIGSILTDTVEIGTRVASLDTAIQSIKDDTASILTDTIAICSRVVPYLCM